eukprot:CAMPEP_0118651476 /NCGR_PEP_ID=MMETSP0785-20121206/10806_1 /TAXON_ID=91992 /ORGANISM="Bolidomonas pacifica, Strain CCMP 1866" /LENGTH=368 /DNA_ID=CAMNT_0006543931 /DNA_START=191 /DNA_END=1293 /DNA_ORIENTATION=+
MKASNKPYRLSVPHRPLPASVSDADEYTVCIIVKDGSKDWVKETVEEQGEKMGFVKKVLTLSKVRKDFKQHQQRRDLLRTYTTFLADDRILPMLSKSLGKSFFDAKKQPIPIRLTRTESFPTTVTKAVEGSAYLYIPSGTTVTVKAGSPMHLTEKQLCENVKEIVEQAVDKLPRKWKGVNEIALRVGGSVGVPVYARSKRGLEDIDNMAGEEEKKKNSSSRKRKEVEAAEEKEGGEEEVKKAKKVKSPLMKALEKGSKKKKKEEEEEKKEEKEEVKKVSRKEKRKALQPEVVPLKKNKKKAVEEKVAKERSEEGKVEGKEKEKGKKDKTGEMGGDPKFKPSNKFKRSLSSPGFVFKLGRKGLGFYKDV